MSSTVWEGDDASDGEEWKRDDNPTARFVPKSSIGEHRFWIPCDDAVDLRDLLVELGFPAILLPCIAPGFYGVFVFNYESKDNGQEESE